MKAYDPQQAARVWQRVQGQKQEEKEPTSRGGDLPGLILAEWLAAETYSQLARQSQQRDAAVLQRMAQEERGHGAALQGICLLTTGSRASVKVPSVGKESTEVTLRRCYSGELQSLAAYEARSSDPEYGAVYARMAEQEREHCQRVLEMLGRLGK